MKGEIDKLDGNKRRFVEDYRKLYGHITNTCAANSIARQTYYNWLDSDPEFAKAIMEAEMELNDDIREVLIKKAGEGDMTAVIFYLKKRHPDFKEQYGMFAGEFKDGDKTFKFVVTRGDG